MLRCAHVGLLATLLTGACAKEAPEVSPPTPLRLVEDWRLDGVAARLSAVRWVDGQRSSGVGVVTTSETGVVQSFDGLGEASQPIGAMGTGPGGFRAVTTVGRTGSGIWIFDNALSRITVVQYGRVQRVENIITALPKPKDSARIGVAYKTDPVFAYYSDGSRLVVAASPHPLVPAEGGIDSQVPRALVRVGRDGVIERVVATVPPDRREVTYRRGQGLSGYRVAIPFMMAPLTAVSNDGKRIVIVAGVGEVGHPSNIVLHVLNAAGDTLVSRSLPVPMIPLPPRVADSALAVARQNARGLPYEAFHAVFDSVARAPSVYPPVDAAVVGDDGTTWVRLGPNPELTAERQWMIVDRHGRVVGLAVSPPDVRIMAVGLDRAWGTSLRSNGLVDVVRYRVTKPDSGIR